MTTDDNPQAAKKAPTNTAERRWGLVKDLVSAAGVIAAIIFSAVATIAAHNATVSANNAQAIFQGGDACRAIRTEILNLHQAGLNITDITTVLNEEQASPEYRAEHPGKDVNALDEDNSECGASPGTVQDWIKIISRASTSSHK
jgi:hypothetical protein